MSFRTKAIMVSPRSYAALQAIAESQPAPSTPDEVADALITRMADEDPALAALSRMRKKAMDEVRAQFKEKHGNWQPKLTIQDGQNHIHKDETQLP